MSTKENAMISRTSGRTNPLWSFFCSLRLTIVTLILLAATSIIGTVIQQNRSPQEYLQVYSESTYRFFEALGFFDMYHSWWFLSLLGLFSVNLIACSINRFPKVWKLVNEPVLVPGDALYRTFSNLEELTVTGSRDEIREKAAGFFRSNFASPVITEEGDKVHLFAQKGAWSRFGVYVTHSSILIIFLGAIIGALWGYKAYVNIVEGTETSVVRPRSGGEPIPLGFTVRADDFNVTYYPGTSRPQEFMSILDVIENGEEVISDRKIVVNDPLTYKGITFYQSSYGQAGDPTITLRVGSASGGDSKTVKARLGEHVPLPSGGSFAVTDYTPSYDRFGPAIQMHVNSPDGQHGNPFIVLQNFPDFDAQRKGDYAFSLLGFEQPQYTGLQVAKDPGVWVVWLGCTLMVIGSMVAFFLSHRRIWVTIQPEGNKTAVKLGGTAHRNQPGFELFFDEFKKKLKTELS